MDHNSAVSGQQSAVRTTRCVLERIIRMRRSIFALLIITVILTGCTKDTPDVSATDPKEIVVFAAASLTEVLGEIKSAYEAEHPEVAIVYNFAGSQVLANQIIEGARPAMYFSANEKYVDKLIDEGVNPYDIDNYMPEKSIFATNELVLVYSEQLDFDGFEGAVNLLAEADYIPVVLALEEVPVGRYTAKMMTAYLDKSQDQTGYDAFYNQVVSYESDVKAVMAKVRIHEADMGIVYKTDAAVVDLEDNGLMRLEIPTAYNQVAMYGALIFSEDVTEAALYKFITEGDGQEILRNRGF